MLQTGRAAWINELLRYIHRKLRDKAGSFTAYSVALDDSTEQTDNAQLAIFISGINDKFEVTEELLTLGVNKLKSERPKKEQT